ncbi:hypothetical protein ABVT39_011203 [Epinephelus coioides]
MEIFLQGCTKEQLLNIAEHYGVVVAGSKRKDDIKETVLSYLFDQGILQKSELGAAEAESVAAQGSVLAGVQAGLSFEQQKELLAMQLQQEQLRLENREKERKFELEKQLELERLRQGTERMKIELEQTRLQLIREGKLSSGVSGLEGSGPLASVPNACAVTRAQSRKLSAPDPPVPECSKVVVPDMVLLPDLPLSASKEDWVKGQSIGNCLVELRGSLLGPRLKGEGVMIPVSSRGVSATCLNSKFFYKLVIRARRPLEHHKAEPVALDKDIHS